MKNELKLCSGNNISSLRIRKMRKYGKAVVMLWPCFPHRALFYLSGSDFYQIISSYVHNVRHREWEIILLAFLFQRSFQMSHLPLSTILEIIMTTEEGPLEQLFWNCVSFIHHSGPKPCTNEPGTRSSKLSVVTLSFLYIFSDSFQLPTWTCAVYIVCCSDALQILINLVEEGNLDLSQTEITSNNIKYLV